MGRKEVRTGKEAGKRKCNKNIQKKFFKGAMIDWSDGSVAKELCKREGLSLDPHDALNRVGWSIDSLITRGEMGGGDS